MRNKYINSLSRFAFLALSIVLLSVAFTTQAKPKEITVAYFLEWPTANQVAQLEKWYDKAMGVRVNWVAFDTGVEMTAAMLSGDVHIAYSQGAIPFTIAASRDVPITMVGVAVSYAENDNCVVANGSGITQATAGQLQGKKVAVPFGTVAHYKMLRTLEHLGVNPEQLDLIDMAPADGAVALHSGDVTMACGWGGALRRMKQSGSVLMTAQEQEDLGIRVFDVISVTNDFAYEYPGLVTTFLEITDRSAKYMERHPDKSRKQIAKTAGMSLSDSNAVLDLFHFPVKEEQLSDAWLGTSANPGTVPAFIKEVADFFVQQGNMPSALRDYSPVIDTSFYENVR